MGGFLRAPLQCYLVPIATFFPSYPGEKRLNQAEEISCLQGTVPQFLIVEEDSDMLNFSLFLTGNGQEGPSLSQAMLIGMGMRLQV